MKGRFAPLALALLCLPAAAMAYDAAALASDSAAFLAAENLMHRNLSASIAALRSSLPPLPSGEGASLGADLSLGEILAPSFGYRQLLAGKGPFETQAGPGESASALLPSLGGALALPGGLGLSLNASFLPPLALGGSQKSLFRIGASGQWRLLQERFYSIGLLVGGGASYVRGTEARSIDTSFLDATTTSAFSGSFDSEWSSGILDLELFAHKTFFIVNFYSRAKLCLVFGSASSTLSGISVDGVPVPAAQARYSSLLQAPAAGLVLSAGMELILGELKLAAEAGRDWISGSLYGSLGLRWGS